MNTDLIWSFGILTGVVFAVLSSVALMSNMYDGGEVTINGTTVKFLKFMNVNSTQSMVIAVGITSFLIAVGIFLGEYIGQSLYGDDADADLLTQYDENTKLGVSLASAHSYAGNKPLVYNEQKLSVPGEGLIHAAHFAKTINNGPREMKGPYHKAPMSTDILTEHSAQTVNVLSALRTNT